jgi:hypothetical protein
MERSEMNMQLNWVTRIKSRICSPLRISLGFVAGGLSIMALSACFNSPAISSGQSTGSPIQTATPLSGDSPSSAERKSSEVVNNQVMIQSIEYFGWWWGDEQFDEKFDLDNPPPKKSYIKLEEWNASQPSAPQPHIIDVVCRIANNSSEAIKISVAATGEFQIESYRVVVTQNSGKSLDEMLDKKPWVNKQPIGKTLSLNLAPGEVKEIKFKGLQIGSLVDLYSNGKNWDFWPWRLRVSISVMSATNMLLAERQSVLNIVPAD